MRHGPLLAVGACAGVTAIGVLVLGPNGPIAASRAERAVQSAQADFRAGDQQAARSTLTQAISDEEAANRPGRAERLGRLKLTMGYVEAREGDFAGARETLLAASRDAASEPEAPAARSLSRQARYQAAVCLLASGNKKGAKEEFAQILREDPASDEGMSAFRRLQKLCGQDELFAHQAILDAGLAKRQAKIALAAAECGPLAVAEVLRRMGKQPPPREELSRICGTTSSGTTMAALARALESQGVRAHGYELNSRDLRRVPIPAVWLKNGHYLVLRSVWGDEATVFDPAERAERRVALPKADDSEFRATVLAVRPMRFQGEGS